MKYSVKEKQLIVREVLCGKSKASVCRERHLDRHLLNIWVGRYMLYGEEGLLGAKGVRRYSPAEKVRIILRHVQEGLSLSQLSVLYGMERRTLKEWLRKVRSGGSLSGVNQENRQSGIMARPRKKEPQTDLERLQAENLRLRAEVALLKKVKALVEEQEARARHSGQEPSKN